MDARLLIAAVFVTATLSGCLAGSGDPVGARSLLEDATGAAEAWTDHPVLIGITSIEPFKQYEDPDGEGAIYVHLDDDPGDGRAPGWVYLFKGEDRIVFIAIASGLGVLAEGWEKEDADDLEEFAMPLDGWKYDSPAVADILADEPDWPEATDETSVFWELYQTDDGPVWEVEWDTFNSSHSARVNADNGTVISTGESYSVSGTWSSTWVSTGGMTTLATPVEASLYMDASGDIEFDAGYSGVGNGDPTVILSGPNGTVYEGTLSPNATARLPDVPAGTYTLTVSADDPTVVRNVSLWLMASWAE